MSWPLWGHRQVRPSLCPAVFLQRPHTIACAEQLFQFSSPPRLLLALGSAANPALGPAAQGVVLGTVSDRPPGNRISRIRVFRQIPMLIDKPYQR